MGLLTIVIGATLWLTLMGVVVAVCSAAARADRRDRSPAERVVSRV
jgi:hypothetical protein